MSIEERDLAIRIGEARDCSHRFPRSHACRHFNERSSIIGARGEIEFGKLVGIPPSSAVGAGDGGVDFVVPGLGTVDVKTAVEGKRDRHSMMLIVQEGKVVADYYVLAVASADLIECVLVGWANSDEVRAAWPRAVRPGGFTNHVVENERLHPIAPLAASISS
jgi:hypothetical protein